MAHWLIPSARSGYEGFPATFLGISTLSMNVVLMWLVWALWFSL